MEKTQDSIILDDDLGSHLERRRFIALTQQMHEHIVPLAAQIERSNSAQMLALLDEQLPNIGGLFDAALRLPQPPFQSLCDLLKQLNKYLNTRGLYREQVEWAQSLLAYFLEHEAETGEQIDLVILNTIASGFNALGKEESALDIYNFSLDLFTDEPQHPALAVISFNAALVHYSLGNFDEALKLCQQAIAIDETHDNRQNLVRSLLLLSDLMHELGKVKDIFHTLSRALDLIESLDNRYLHAQITSKMALQIARYHDKERAAGLFKEAIAMWREIGDEQQLANTLFFYATLLQATGSQAEALAYAEESLRLLERLNLPDADQVREDIEKWRSNGCK
jgi:tetratricopeptide (TPR) repeat protein